MTTSSENDTALSIGGLEAGTGRFAFYADYDFTQVELGGHRRAPRQPHPRGHLSKY